MKRISYRRVKSKILWWHKNDATLEKEVWILTIKLLSNEYWFVNKSKAQWVWDLLIRLGHFGPPLTGLIFPFILLTWNNSCLPDFEPPSDGDNKDHLIIVVVAAVVLLGLLTLFVMWRKGWMGDDVSANKGMKHFFYP